MRDISRRPQSTQRSPSIRLISCAAARLSSRASPHSRTSCSSGCSRSVSEAALTVCRPETTRTPSGAISAACSAAEPCQTPSIRVALPLTAAASGTVASISSLPGVSASLRLVSVSEWLRNGTLRITVSAARAAETVILSVPFRNHSETLTNLKDALTPGKLLIDATVPLAAAAGGKATRMLGVWQGSAAQQAAEMAPDGVRVVSALHTVSAASLANLEHPLEQDVLVCGDSRADKREAAALIELIDGLRCVDCGRLEMARTTEALTALLISVNSRYKAHAGIRLTSLPDSLWA